METSSPCSPIKIVNVSERFQINNRFGSNAERCNINCYGGQEVRIADDLLDAITTFANGDACRALSTLEMVVLNSDTEDDVVTVTPETVRQCTGQRSLLYDKTGEEHYNIISALHKSMRNSDPWCTFRAI